MLGLDDRLAELGGTSVWLALVVAVLLGLRHATDPDHLTAVATLVAGDARHGRRRATILGLAWGCGHALTLLLLGLPLVLAGSALPDRVAQVAEVVIGVLICGLALRLLLRWRAGVFHVHVHEHDGALHAHHHVHPRRSPHGRGEHGHAHAERLGRTPAAAFGVGLVHGVGGSAGAGILLVGAAAEGAAAVAALALFAAGTALSMAAVSAVVGRGLARRRVERLVPAMGAASLAFGVWYAAAALDAAPYPF